VETNVEESKAMRMSTQPSAVRIVVDREQLENVEYLSCLGKMVANGARRGPTREIKHRIATAEDSTRRRPFYQQIGLKFKAEYFCVVLKLGHCGM
jgi:hypothetical protein